MVDNAELIRFCLIRSSASCFSNVEIADFFCEMVMRKALIFDCLSFVAAAAGSGAGAGAGSGAGADGTSATGSGAGAGVDGTSATGAGAGGVFVSSATAGGSGRTG